MRLAMFGAVAVLATCVQAKESVPFPQKAEAILLKPTNHVCVSATVNDDIPSINHVVFTDEVYSNAFGGEIVDILENRLGRSDVIEQSI